MMAPIKRKKTIVFQLLVFFLTIALCTCKQSSCDSIPREFSSFEEAIKFIKNANFKFKEATNTSKSSWILSATYFSCNEDSGYVIVGMQKNEYLYQGIPKSLWEEFKNAKSLGQFYDENIRGKYAFVLNDTGTNTKDINSNGNGSDVDMPSFQKKINEIADSFDSGFTDAPNRSDKKLFKDHPLEYFNSLIEDSVGKMQNFRVRVMSIDHEKENGKVVLHAFFDDGKIVYMGYAKFKNEEDMMEDATYKFISGFREQTDTVISFMYLMHVYKSHGRYILQVIPMPKEGVDYATSSYSKNHLVDLTHWLTPNNF